MPTNITAKGNKKGAAHIIWDILNLREEKEIKKPPKYQKNFLFDSDVKFPEFIIFGVKKCGTG